MATAAVEHEQAEQPFCWCCGNTFEESDLTRLGNHPEVGVCARCAQWLHRRARSPDQRGRATRRGWLLPAVEAARARVMRAGVHDWPVVGSLLRRLDRHLP
jgi:hypothetical protein